MDKTLLIYSQSSGLCSLCDLWGRGRGEFEDVVEVQRYLDTLKAYHKTGHQTGIAEFFIWEDDCRIPCMDATS